MEKTTTAKNKQIYALLPNLNEIALSKNEFWPVAKVGKNTKRILGKYKTYDEAKSRAEKYRGKHYQIWICGFKVNNHNEIPTI